MKSKIDHSGLRTWIEVDRKAIKHNYSVFRSIISKNIKLLAVVKSNAYGHDFFQFAREMENPPDGGGADFLGVDSVVEGLALRREGIKIPILVLGYTLPEKIIEAVKNNLSITISSLEQLQTILARGVLAKISGKLKIHIKVDTGMHRQGFLMGHQKTLSYKLQAISSKLVIEGLYTHFASAKNPAFPKDTKKQIEEFEKWIKIFKDSGFSPIVHASATAGTILFPESHFDMVRIGIGLYGKWPAKEVKAYAEKKISLQPVLEWKTIISEIKFLKKGERLGYDLAETLYCDSVIGICPVGYWHGFPRALSSVGSVLVKGKRAKILGRVSMDMIVVDLTKIQGVKVGDVATLIGKDGKEEIDAVEMANLSDTSDYEILTRLNPLIKRIYK